MRRRSKNTKTVNIIKQQTSEDQNNSVLGRLPWKSVARFLVVLKSWEEFIRSRYFITSFPFGSSLSSQPRLLTTFSAFREGRQYLDFFSSSSSSTSFISRFTCPLSTPEREEYLLHYVNGLISLGCHQEQIIYNPTTGKSITLPRVVTWRKIVKTYFGYDPVNDQYKVLGLTRNIYDNLGNFQSFDHKVLTFGARESWREMDDCSIPHRPWSNGLCIDGVLYYLALTGKGVLLFSLMRFDLRSEKLDLLTGLPASLKAPDAYTLIKYKGKVAITTRVSACTFDVLVMEEDGWLKTSFSIESCTSLQMEDIHIKGTTRIGEIILAPFRVSNAFYVVFYNPNSNSCRNIKIEVNSDYDFKTTPYPELAILSDYLILIMFFNICVN